VGWVYGKYVDVNSASNLPTQDFGDLTSGGFLDFDFKSRRFILITGTNREGIDATSVELEQVLGDDTAVWFVPNDVRNAKGTAQNSDLVVSKRSSGQLILRPEFVGYGWYAGESHLLKISGDNRFVVVDTGTSPLRQMSVLDLSKMKLVAGGAYKRSMYQDNSRYVAFLEDPKRVNGLATFEKFYLEHGLVSFSGIGVSGKVTTDSDFRVEEWMNSSTDFYYVTLAEFDLETGLIETTNNVFCYTDE